MSGTSSSPRAPGDDQAPDRDPHNLTVSPAPLSPVQASPITPRPVTPRPSPAPLAPAALENHPAGPSGTGAQPSTSTGSASVLHSKQQKRKSTGPGSGTFTPPVSGSNSRSRTGSFTPVGHRLRSASQSFFESNPRPGIWAATGELLARGELVDSRRSSMVARENAEKTGGERGRALEGAHLEQVKERRKEEEAGVVVEGVGKWAKTKRGLLWFWNFVKTPMGAFITLYSLLVIIFGAWLFFLLLNALPSYNKPNKDHPDSPRRIWVEITSQIMNALFCVTAFGLAPWRFRDAFYLVRWRFANDKKAGSRIREINAGWYVPELEDAVADAEHRAEIVRRVLDSAPASVHTDSKPSSTHDSVHSKPDGPNKLTKDLPAEKIPEIPDEPATAHTTAPPTKPWKLHFVVWMYIANTALQCVLCGYMWGYDRLTRPGAAVGALVAVSCGVAGAAGGLVWWEGRRVKKCSSLSDEERGTIGEQGKR